MDDIERGARQLLPERTQGYTQQAIVGGCTIYIRTEEFADGTLGQLEIDLRETGATTSTLRALLQCFAKSVTVALQYGVPLAVLVDEFSFTKFEPAGAVKGNGCIEQCSSIIDYVFRELAVSYLGHDHYAHVKPEGIPLDEVGDAVLVSLIPGGYHRKRVPDQAAGAQSEKVVPLQPRADVEDKKEQQ